MNFGRKIIYTATEHITPENVLGELNRALTIHGENRLDELYLWNYYRGDQPIRNRVKLVRPEINNAIVENHAQEITNFRVGYLFGEPCGYVHRGEVPASGDGIRQLNDYMFANMKSSKDRKLAQWMHICGVGVRMILPTQSGDTPFEIETMEPMDNFVVYWSGFGNKPVMGCHGIVDNEGLPVWSVWTETDVYEIRNGNVKHMGGNMMGLIPIIEYPLNPERMGCFEPVLPLLDELNNLASNRMDGVEQFVQSFMKFINCELTVDELNQFRQNGAIMLHSDNEVGNSDVEIMSSELNQSQTQTLVDYVYSQVLTITGIPSTTKGGTSTSDTGQAVVLRDGWQQAASRAKGVKEMFTESEMRLLDVVFKICPELGLQRSDVEVKLSWQNTENILTKVQSLQTMLECGVAPDVAFATSDIWSDPMDKVQRSLPYLKKWDPDTGILELSLDDSAVSNLTENSRSA